jgi:hypothetical protein
MSDFELYNTIISLPESLKKEAEDFVFSLSEKIKRKKERQFGVFKGKIKMASDFDEPLDDFKEYM